MCGILATGKRRIVAPEHLQRTFRIADITNVWTGFHYRSAAFLVLALSRELNLDTRRSQTFRCGLHHSRTGMVGPEVDGRLAIGDENVAAGTESDAPPRGELSGSGDDGEGHIGRIGKVAPGSVFHLYAEYHVVRPVCAYALRPVRRERQFGRLAFHRPSGRRNAHIFIPIPIPRAFGHTEIVHDAHLGHDAARDAAVVETAPDGLPATPRESFVAVVLLQVAPSRRIFSRTVGRDATVFGYQRRPSRVLEVGNHATVAVVARNVGQAVDASLAQRTLRAADGCRSSGIELVRQGGTLPQQRAHPVHGFRSREEGFVAHAPGYDGRMVAMDANHLGQLRLHVAAELLAVFLPDGISAGIPIAVFVETADAPEGVLGPEKQSLAVASIDKGRRMGVVRTADEIETDVLHHAHVAPHPALRHGIAPSGMVLMHIGAPEIEVFPVEEEATVGRPFRPAETKGRLGAVQCAPATRERRDYRI